jgi:hypothetical protein
MAKHHFLVERYQVTLGDHDSTWGGTTVRTRGIVACFGEFLRLLFYFLPEGAATPDPIWIEDARVNVVFMPIKDMAPFVDILRNEKPIYGNIDTEAPGDSFISTLHEPVGEEEKGGFSIFGR